MPDASVMWSQNGVRRGAMGFGEAVRPTRNDVTGRMLPEVCQEGDSFAERY